MCPIPHLFCSLFIAAVPDGGSGAASFIALNE
nr:MAG TPA: hypothetical protein [Caudoviricetes sp.]